MCRRILENHGKYFRGSASSLPLLDSTIDSFRNYELQMADENSNVEKSMRNAPPPFEMDGTPRNSDQDAKGYSRLIFVLIISISSGLTVLGMVGTESFGGIQVINFSVTLDSQFCVGLLGAQCGQIIVATATTIFVTSLVYVTKCFCGHAIVAHLFTPLLFFSNYAVQTISIAIPPLQFLLGFFGVMRINEQKMIMDSPSSSDWRLSLIENNGRVLDDDGDGTSVFKSINIPTFESIASLLPLSSVHLSSIHSLVSFGKIVDSISLLTLKLKGIQSPIQLVRLPKKVKDLVANGSSVPNGLNHFLHQKNSSIVTQIDPIDIPLNNTPTLGPNGNDDGPNGIHLSSNESEVLRLLSSEDATCCEKFKSCDFVSQDDLLLLLNRLECINDEAFLALQSWESIVEKKSTSLEYTAFRRDLPNGPTEYYSKTRFHNCNAQTLCDFYMDNEFLVEWDNMVKSFRRVHFCPFTGNEVGHYMKKYPFCSPNEYVLSWKLWKQDSDTFYCITKAVDNVSEFDLELKHNQVKVYHSAWRIRQVEGENSCEIEVFAKEDCGLHKDMAKMLFRRSIWNYVKQTEKQLRIFQKTEKRTYHSLNAHPFPYIPQMVIRMEDHSILHSELEAVENGDHTIMMHKRTFKSPDHPNHHPNHHPLPHHLPLRDESPSCALMNANDQVLCEALQHHKSRVSSSHRKRASISNPLKLPLFLVSGALVLANPVAPFGAKLVMISLLRSLS